MKRQHSIASHGRCLSCALSLSDDSVRDKLILQVPSPSARVHYYTQRLCICTTCFFSHLIRSSSFPPHHASASWHFVIVAVAERVFGILPSARTPPACSPPEYTTEHTQHTSSQYPLGSRLSLILRISSTWPSTQCGILSNARTLAQAASRAM